MRTRFLWLLFAGFFLGAVAFLAHPAVAAADSIKVSGGAKAYKLAMDKTYKKYDITGDRKADKIRLRTDANSEGYINTMTVMVNGKKALTKAYHKEAEAGSVLRAYPQAVLIRLKNKKPFLYIHFSTYNGYYAGGWVYRYQSGGLQEIYSTSTLIEKYMAAYPGAWRAYEVLSKVKSNKVYFIIGSSTTGEKTYSVKLSALKPVPAVNIDLSAYYREPYEKVIAAFSGGTDVTSYAEYNQYYYRNTAVFFFPKPVADPSRAPLDIIQLEGELNGMNLFGATVGMDREEAFEKFREAGFSRTTAVGITYYWEDAQGRQLCVEADSSIKSIRFGMW